MVLRLVFVLVSICVFGHAKILNQGEAIPPFSLPDQFDKVHQVNSRDFKVLFVAFEKEVAVLFNTLLQSKPTSFLQEHKALFISDIHEMPLFITKMFALPKMREYPYPVLLMYEKREVFPQKENAITVIHIDKNAITHIHFVAGEEEIKAMLDTIGF
ncbi:MAG: hypothetical protein IBX45_11770 [Campylobacterales bacterium]|nr:hypothetical protein [Campylobacterales bacterium]